ncbi:MAG: ribonuclease P protein component 4 [Candidatus Micrarchaeia archaeon]
MKSKKKSGGTEKDAARLAKRQADELLGLAKKTLDEDEKLSKRYVSLARKIAMRHRVKLGNDLFCKNCDSVFVAGKTFKSRVQEGRVVWTCTKCGKRQTKAVKRPKKGGILNLKTPNSKA